MKNIKFDNNEAFFSLDGGSNYEDDYDPTFNFVSRRGKKSRTQGALRFYKRKNNSLNLMVNKNIGLNLLMLTTVSIFLMF